MKTILIVDQHAIVRTGIRKLLADEADLEVVGEAARGEEAVRAARDLRPDVVLLDVGVADMSGLEIARRLARARPAPNLVALGVHRDGPYPAHLLEMGVCGYLTKDCSQADLVLALRKATRGERYVSAEVARSMVLGRLETERAPITTLTARELSVMVMVAQGHNRAEISQTLCVSPKTVSTYRTRVLRKLGASSDVELTHLSLRHGLIGPMQGGTPAPR
jgi:two-component system invasion response regulator UvrY